MDTLELDDIQGYIIRGYSNQQYSRFVLLKVTDPVAAKQWLRQIIDSITPATHIHDKTKLPPTSLNIAFTHRGLSALNMHAKNLETFSLEFREGMVTPHRQRILGDFGSSDPAHWKWGNYTDTSTHLVLMIFGTNKEVCLDYYHQLKERYTHHGLQEHKLLDGQTLPKNKEHFGFRDGISQPVIEGSGRPGLKFNTVKPGEFILGYKNEYNVFPDSPMIVEEQGDLNFLPSDAAGSGAKDLGKNGSFLVIRQLQEHVEMFWDFINKNASKDGEVNVDASNKLAAKLMGRWPSGAPLTKFPDADPGNDSDDNDFGYADTDAEGFKCPLGSHVRRCNPRDSFEDDSKKESIKLSNRHRIIRRARLYGDPFAGSPLNTQPKTEVGLIFNCFNADISRQFELISHTWANSTKTKNLYDDPDPIIGVMDYNYDDELPNPPRSFRKKDPEKSIPQNFTIQSCPVNKVIPDLQRFVTVKGGAYFFFPSITAIRYIATI